MTEKNTSVVFRESKSQLARLMANENLTIEHRAVRTASFDVESRILTLPIWTDMTGNIYDTLVGHEVGHALDTPANENAIFSAIDSIDAKNKRGAKMFLNVVEDARIEKIVRRRYPGMRRSFSLGYKELLDRNFFGTRERDIQTYKLIDRINLHFKLGSAVIIGFSPEEMKLVRMVEDSETFDDVVATAKAIYEYAKLHNEKQSDFDDDGHHHQSEDPDMYPDDSGDYYTENESSDKVEKNESESSESDSSESDSSESDSSESDSSESESKSIDEKTKTDKVNSNNTNASDTEDAPIDDVGIPENNPTSETQEAWENQKNKLLSGSVRGYYYCNIPEIDGHKWIVPYKQIHYGNGETYDGISTIVSQKSWNGDDGINQDMRFTMLKKFKNENAPIISFMVKEFEMRKAAMQYARQSIAKTGVINTNKLHTYKYNDDIFRRIINVATGKNHGLVLILDWSGSMSNHIAGTIDQLLNMVLFCRRVQIPFEVFAFSDCYEPRQLPHTTKYDKGDLMVAERLSLLQLLSSTMTMNELNDAMGNLLALGTNFIKNNVHARSLGRFNLGGTPLDGALICLPSIVNGFRTRNKLQIVNTIILTDGDNSHNFQISGVSRYYHETKICVVRDKVTKAEYQIHDGQELTKVLLKNLEDRTNAKVIGYYLISGSSHILKRTIHQYFHDNEVETAFNKFNEKKYLEITNMGYAYYYIIKGNNLQIEAEELNVGRATSAKAIAKAFGNYSKNKLENRVMLSRFIEKIS